ncbi:MAG: hypothetical protein Q4A90_02480 [Streptococcus sp.]|nr:hypothetical protein [Streptococcus sp.]
MKKFLSGILLGVMIILLVGGIILFFTPKEKNGILSNLNAQKNKDNEKYITINNETEEVWNKLIITTKDKTMIAEKENPDDNSFSIKIPESFRDETTYVIEVEDRYHNKYKSEITMKSKKGRKSITITKNNLTEKGSWSDKLNKWVNK